MKLPCWIKHSWKELDFKIPVNYIFRANERVPVRVCKKCGDAQILWIGWQEWDKDVIAKRIKQFNTWGSF